MSLLLAALALFPPEPPSGRPEAASPVPAEDRGRLEDSFPGPQAGFMLRLQSLCGGGSFQGRIVSNDPQDEDWRGKELTLGPARCTLTDDARLARIEMPLAVGADASRTWVVSHHPDGLRLRHRHAHGGAEDAVSGYGGLTADEGTFSVQAFPADEDSRALFEREGIPASKANVWTMEIVPGDRFAYALNRPGRTFRAEFDLGQAAGSERRVRIVAE